MIVLLVSEFSVTIELLSRKGYLPCPEKIYIQYHDYFRINSETKVICLVFATNNRSDKAFSQEIKFHP